MVPVRSLSERFLYEEMAGQPSHRVQQSLVSDSAPDELLLYHPLSLFGIARLPPVARLTIHREPVRLAGVRRRFPGRGERLVARASCPPALFCSILLSG